MNPTAEVDRLLKENKAALKRHKKHEVWELPNGRTFIRACTPSDCRSGDNELANLRNALGIAVARGLPGERREKRPKQQQEQKRHWTATPTINTAVHDQLAKVGLVEDSLRQQIKQLQHELSVVHRASNERRNEIMCLKQECWCQHIRRFKQRVCEIFWTIFSWN